MTEPLSRRQFLRNSGLLVLAGAVACDQLELLERIGWRRRFFPGWSERSPLRDVPVVVIYDQDGKELARQRAERTENGVVHFGRIVVNVGASQRCQLTAQYDGNDPAYSQLIMEQPKIARGSRRTVTIPGIQLL